MRDCTTCTAKNRECIFGDDWESCLTCNGHGDVLCNGSLDLSRITWCNIDIRTVENELLQLQARAEKDSQLLASLRKDVKAKQTTLAVLMSSGAEDVNLSRLRSETEELKLTGKQVFDRNRADRLAHKQLLQRLKELREQEDNLFQDILCQVQRRTVNDCFECQSSGKVCSFSDESEQCTECQHPPRQRCQGSVDDDDTDRFAAALETVDNQIDEVLSRTLHDSTPYLTLKARLKEEEDATMVYRNRSGLTAQELQDRYRLSSQVVKAKGELEEIRKRSLIDDVPYQELRIRRRILHECHFELLQRGVFYYDELEELAGYPEQRGLTRAEDMDHAEFREAVEWAIEHPSEWQESPPPVAMPPNQGMDQDYASDSGVEL